MANGPFRLNPWEGAKGSLFSGRRAVSVARFRRMQSPFEFRTTSQISSIDNAAPLHYLLYELHSCICRAIRGLISIAAMPVAVDHRNTANVLALNTWPALTHGAKTDAVADDAQSFDSLAISQRRTQVHCSLHDSYGEILVGLRLPIILLIATAEHRATA